MSDLDYRYCLNCNEPLIQNGWSKDKKVCNRVCIDQFVKFRNRLKTTKIKCKQIQKELSYLNKKQSELKSDPIPTKQREERKTMKKRIELENKFKNLKCFIKYAEKKLDEGYPAQKLNIELSKAKRGEQYLPIPMVVLQK